MSSNHPDSFITSLAFWFWLGGLVLLTALVAAPSASSAGYQFTANAELRWSDEEGGENYVADIQALYKLNDPSEALVKHINNLLEFYAYGDERVIAGSRLGTPSRHRIHLSDRGEIITTTIDGTQSRQSRLRVFGVNPYLGYRCVETTASCWVIDPVTSERWLQFVENREAGRELTRALTELIKQLQST